MKNSEDIIKKALKYATIAHKHQYRKNSKLPYITHPIMVSLLLRYFLTKTSIYKNHNKLIVAAILHDVLEDTNATYSNLVDNFGIEVADIVVELTNDELLVNNIGKLEYLKQKMLSMEGEVLLIKLVDRFHNILDQPNISYVVDTLELMQFLKLILRDDLRRIDFHLINLIEEKCRKYIFNLEN